MAVKEVSRTGIRMTKKNRLAIVKRAREIITDPKRWTKGRLRRKAQGQYRYCLLGACEQAVYDLGLAEPGKQAFVEPNNPFTAEEAFGYALGRDVSIYDFAVSTRGVAPDFINDMQGHEGALKLLDDYIKELKKPGA